MPKLNKFVALGILTLGSPALINANPAFATQSLTPSAPTPATALPVPAPEPATLQDPNDATTTLDQQSQTPSAADTEIKAPPTAATAAKPAAAAQPQVTAPAAKTTADLPTLSAVLEQAGIKKPGNAAAETAQEVPPLQAPPGLDLPLNDNLPESTEKTEEQKKAEMRQKAFQSASEGLMPMKTEEIRKLLEMYDETQQAVQTPIYPNPKPESTFQTISLDPGTEPVEIKTAVGHVTTMSIVDASGQPWPIQDISWAGNFEVLQPENGSNMLRITPMSDFAQGNVSMRLVGLNPPVIISLRTERKSVQVRADIQIPELGPNGVAPPIQRQITTTAGDNKLATILEGVAPSSASKLKVDGIDGRTTAYDLGGVTYVRTPYTLLSPAWDSSVRSADGTNVYAMKFTPVLLLSDKGKMLRAQLTKADMSDE